MVKRSVEYCLFICRAALYLYAAQLLIPGIYSLTTYILKCLPTGFCHEILSCPFDIHKRDSNLQLYLFARLCGKLCEEPHMAALYLVLTTDYRCLGNVLLICGTIYIVVMTADIRRYVCRPETIVVK